MGYTEPQCRTAFRQIFRPSDPECVECGFDRPRIRQSDSSRYREAWFYDVTVIPLRERIHVEPRHRSRDVVVADCPILTKRHVQFIAEWLFFILVQPIRAEAVDPEAARQVEGQIGPQYR